MHGGGCGAHEVRRAIALLDGDERGRTGEGEMRPREVVESDVVAWMGGECGSTD